MAKRTPRQDQELNVLTHKELARARRESRGRRQTLLALSAVSAVVIVILTAGIVSELIVKPGQPVATVDGVEVKTADFQERVRLERGQTINLIYQYADLLGVEQVSGIAAQLDDHEAIGERVLDTMVDEVLVRRAAAELGVVVAEDEVSQQLEEQAGYYRGGTPTPVPTFTPRPSPTPITPTETVATPVPTLTPLPTPTAVSEEGYQQIYGDRIRSLRQQGVHEETFRNWVEYQLLVEQVREQLMKDVPTEMDQVQLDMLTFATEEEANGYVDRLAAGESFADLVAVARADTEDTVGAVTVPWTPLAELSSRYGTVIGQLAFVLETGSHSGVTETEDGQFIIFQVTGHGVRQATQSVLSSREQEVYTTWLASLREAATVVKHDYWRNRVPTTPTLDLQSLIPTATPSGE